MTIRWLPKASRDARSIWLYIAADSKHHADAWFETVLDALDMLESRPFAGRPRTDLMADLRSKTLGNYLLLYRPIEDGIELLRVLHGARDLRCVAFD